MTKDEEREKIIQELSEILRYAPLTIEFKVKKHPKGIRIIYEVTQEKLDMAFKKSKAEREEGEQ